MKLIFGVILQLLIASFCLYHGIGGFVGMYNFVNDRLEIIDVGVVAEATIIEETNAYAGADNLDLAKYKFQVDGYENPHLSLMKESREMLWDMPDSFKKEHPDLFNDDFLSTVYGEDFRSSFASEIKPGSTVKIIYDPNDPERNMGGDRRGSTFFEMTKGIRLIAVRTALTVACGLLATAYFILSVYVLVKRHEAGLQ